MSVRIDRKAANRAQAASKHGRIGEGGGEVEKSLKRPILRLGYPVSANRYWRTCRGRTYRSSEAEQYKASVNTIATAAGLIAIEGPAAVSITLHPKLTKKGVARARAAAIRMFDRAGSTFSVFSRKKRA